jgi:hypothetical protein
MNKQAEIFLNEIWNQSSEIKNNDKINFTPEYECNLIELGSYDGFTASYNSGLEWRLKFWRINENDDVISGYFSLYLLFYNDKTLLICECVKDIEDCESLGGISYAPKSKLIYEKEINAELLGDYDFQEKEFEAFKNAVYEYVI